MRSRAKRKQVTVEWTIGDFTIDGGGELTAPSSDLFSPSPPLQRAMQQNQSQYRSHHDTVAAKSITTAATQVRLLDAYSLNQQSLQTEKRLVLDLARWLAIALLGLLFVSSAAPSPQIHEREAITRAVKRSLTSEDMAWRTGNEAGFARILDEDAPASWYRSWRKNWQVGQMHAASHPQIEESQIQSLFLHDGIAVVNVLIDRPPNNSWQLTPLIETRFYRHPAPSPEGDTALLDEKTAWIRTAPTAAFWGEELRLETAHLRFDYYAHDAEIIEAAAPQLESIYVELFRMLGGTEPSPTEKVNLVFVQSVDHKWESPGNVIEIISPTLMPRPLGLDSTDAFIDTVFTRLSFRVMADAIPGTRSYWNTIGVGIRTWLRTQITDVPSPWHDYTDELFYDTLRRNLPLSPLDIDDGRRVNLPMNDTLVWQSRVAQSMIEYSISTHGPAAVPRLLDGFNRYRRWGDLIPHVYGMEADEWEVGWNNYLRRILKLHDEAISTASSDPPQEGRPTDQVDP